MIIADTGFWLALANKNDCHHDLSIKSLQQINEPLITTWPVMTETCHLLLNRLGQDSQLKFIQSLASNSFQIFNINDGHHQRLLKLMKQYKDLPMDLADASLVLLAEHLGHGKILSTDQRDFRSYRWKRHKPFENLLET